MITISFLSGSGTSIETRPIVVVEDHFHHISKLAQSISKNARELYDSLTIVCLDRPGPDTTHAALELAERHPTLQLVAAVDQLACREAKAYRVAEFPESMLTDQNEYCKTIASLLRPNGLLIQDIELETLEFIPKDRWWESTFLATTIRGIFGQGNLNCCFFSNKKGYEATFGAELLASGHDPRNVLNKNDLDKIVVPKMFRFLKETFLWTLNYLTIGNGDPRPILVSENEQEKRTFENALDLLIGPPQNKQIAISGNAFVQASGSKLSIDSNEAITWRDLVTAAFRNQGISTHELGKRIAAEGASKAEATNSAARHIHSLRKKLDDANSIITVDGEYRLGDGLTVGLMESNPGISNY